MDGDLTGTVTGTNAGTTTVATGTDAGTQKQEKTFTQEQVNAMMATEKRQGKESVLNELGVKDVNVLKNALELLQKQENEKKTDAQIASEKAVQVVKENELLKAKLFVVSKGAKPEHIDELVILAQANGLDKVEEFLTGYKVKQPDWFNSPEQQAQDNAGTGTSATGGKTGTKKTQGIGSRLAESKARAVVANPYFKN